MTSQDIETQNIEKLYKNFGVLADAKDKISEHEEEYIEILSAVKGSSKEKRLASQFIARFFKHFPTLSEQAMDAQLDLCEDEDVAIRKQAIKDLPTLCRDSKEYTHKIADILAQLLMAESPGELGVVNLSLVALLRSDPRGALSGLFTQVRTGDDRVRARCIAFISAKVRLLGHDVIGKEAEDFLVAEVKKVLLEPVTSDELTQLMELLRWTRLSTTVAGQQAMVDICVVQAGIGETFDTDPEAESADKLVQCCRHALPFFSSQVDSARLVRYLVTEVLPKLPALPDSEQRLALLKVFAELTTYCAKLDDAADVVNSLLQRVIEWIPVPEEGQEEGARLEYSQIECLLYGYHRLLRQCPETLAKDPDVLKDVRFRLQFLARGVQAYIKELRLALQGKTGDELKSDENKLRAVAFRTTSNINALIKDLFHTPPIFKASVAPSWRPTSLASANKTASPDATGVTEAAVGKRHAPITFGEDAVVAKTARSRPEVNKSNRELYAPPGGKFSQRVSSYDTQTQPGRGGGNRGRGRGNRGWGRGFRGRRNF